MIILAIDPGTRESGVVSLDASLYDPTDWTGETWSARPEGVVYDNEELLGRLRGRNICDAYVIEMKHFHGKDSKAGAETFESCVWIGRFMEAIRKEEADEERIYRITRSAVRTQICGTARSGDKEVRQALIDRFGGDSVALKGRKCSRCKGSGSVRKMLRLQDRYDANPPVQCPLCGGSGWERPPGPLAGITSHMWAALAVAVTWAETQKEKP